MGTPEYEESTMNTNNALETLRTALASLFGYAPTMGPLVTRRLGG
jgi:hypothetical protein